MNSALVFLRRSGWLLLSIGIIDIGYMVYCIINKISYGSSFNIFAVIAGIYLLNGNLKAARLTSFFAAFLFAGFSGALLITPFLLPFDLIVVYTKIYAKSVWIFAILLPLILIMLFWIYRQLTSKEVLTAMNDADIDTSSFWRRPKSGFWFGAGLVVLLFVLVQIPFYSEARHNAMQRAAAEVGPNYKLHISSFRASYTGGTKYYHAIVTAYDDSTIKNISVDWQE